jgi:ATP-dependent Clp protease ATP-binding subunit ClpC
MFERFTERARRVLFFARYESSQLGQKSIEPEHLLLGLLRERHGGALLFLQQLPSDVRTRITTRMTAGDKIPASVEIPFSAPAKRALQAAAQQADHLRHAHVGTEHLLLGLLADSTTVACEILNANGLTFEAVRKEIADRPADGSGGDTVDGHGDAEIMSWAAGSAAARGVNSIIEVVSRFGAHPGLTEKGRQLVDRICRDLDALKSEIDGEHAS